MNLMRNEAKENRELRDRRGAAELCKDIFYPTPGSRLQTLDSRLRYSTPSKRTSPKQLVKGECK
jgi:hypothetical protein